MIALVAVAMLLVMALAAILAIGLVRGGWRVEP